MPLRLEGGSSPPARYRVLSPKAGEVIFVQLVVPPSGIVGTRAHWSPAVEGLVPCLHEDCVFCPNDPAERWQGYAPCVYWLPKVTGYVNSNCVYDGRPGAWAPGILRVTEHMRNLLAEDARGQVMEVWRPGTKRNGRVFCKKVAMMPGDQPTTCQPFDVAPSLRAIWREWANIDAKRRSSPTEPRLHAPEAG